MNDLISIVLPVYNGAQFLQESIESVLAQTYPNWELLILDDCSTDATPEIAKQFQDKDSRIHYFRNETNLKLPGNLNKGFSLAKGNFLTWTSDDNRFLPTALEKMLSVLIHSDAQLVYASYQVMDEKGIYTQIMQVDPRGKEHIWGGNVVGACFLYTRAVYEKIGNYDTNLFLVEDFDYWQRVFTHFPVACIEEVLYEYRQHPASLTSTKNEVRYGEVLEQMLMKNHPDFSTISLEAAYFYYKALKHSRDFQQRKNKDAVQYYILHIIYRIKNLIHRFLGV